MRINADLFVIVLPLANSPGGHRLGVNGLAVDSEHSILCVLSSDFLFDAGRFD